MTAEFLRQSLDSGQGFRIRSVLRRGDPGSALEEMALPCFNARLRRSGRCFACVVAVGPLSCVKVLCKWFLCFYCFSFALPDVYCVLEGAVFALFRFFFHIVFLIVS